MQRIYIEAISEAITEHFDQLKKVIEDCKKLKTLRSSHYQAYNELHSGLDVVEKNRERYTEEEQRLRREMHKAYQEIGYICDGYKTIEPLTVGIFGEWGSGKTHILKGIKYTLYKRQEESLRLWEGVKANREIEELIVPVFFNAWRFEKEEHIIIPLFRTMITALEEYEHIDFFKRVSIKFKFLLTALLQNLKLPDEIPDLKKIVFTQDVTELAKIASFFKLEKIKRQSNPDEFISALLSSGSMDALYIDIPRWIEKITIFDKIRFVFLIDDLDRCLPENTLKVLESIKLFLDVPGCSFVLALDDDVVERGVEHHYKEYKFDPKDQHALPITGSEYLEKLIQLPFRIPPNDGSNTRDFLLEKFEELFENEERVNGTLLDFMSKNIPPYPRKIIRTMTLYKSKLDILKRGNIPIEELLLAKLTLLELFVPKLFRFLKQQKYFELEFDRVVRWKKDFEKLTETVEIEEKIESASMPQEEKDLSLRLLAIIKEHNKNRIRFDLDEIFDGDFDKELLERYIKLRERKSAPQSIEEVIESKALGNRERFYEYLFSQDNTSWQKAFKEEELENAYFELEEEFIQRAKESQLYKEPAWLKIVSKHLSKSDFLTLIERTDPLKELQ